MSSAEGEAKQQPASSGTYEAGCHCGYVKFRFALSPPLPEYRVMQCNCSACTKLGYLLVYPKAEDVTWHNDSRGRCAEYRFNTKQKDQMFCPRCGTSIGIDFRDTRKPHTYGISARTIYGVDLDSLDYEKGDGMSRVPPARDLSGQWWDEERGKMK
ncbi:hypothetical protein DL770_006954 [Monosporascus sp. CRB-9-2]|nr:hypothetical protein DL770_006954 [Monosporascus sp. CRB-9-2]